MNLVARPLGVTRHIGSGVPGQRPTGSGVTEERARDRPRGRCSCQTRVIRPWAARQGVLSMRRHIGRALYAAVAAITLGTLGFAGAASPASAASRAMSPPGYSPSWAGYSVGGGRWFRFISTTVTVPPHKRRLGAGHRALSWPAGREALRGIVGRTGRRNRQRQSARQPGRLRDAAAEPARGRSADPQHVLRPARP